MINIVYWSGTGNTELMAEYIQEVITAEKKDVKLIPVSNASIDDVLKSDIVVLGCPSMGDEVLEESEMEPFMETLDDKLEGKKVFLFGSYDWGDGEWMENWVERVEKDKALSVNSIIVNNTPEDNEDINKLKEFGEQIAKAI